MAWCLTPRRTRKSICHQRPGHNEAQKRYAQTPAGRYGTYKRSARLRGIRFALSFEQFYFFWQKPCFYCGYEIKTIGLDRRDNTIGYTMANSLPCCFLCNRGKGELTHLQWVALCSNVVRRHGLVHGRV